ncbi:MAG: ABC transporter permease [Alphaproteobacteria bacterium]
MIRSIPQSGAFKLGYGAYVLVFFVYLFAPLVVVGVFAFNDSQFPSLPWRGFTLDWFLSSTGRIGIFHDNGLIGSVGTSLKVGVAVTALSVTVGTVNAFLLERARFPGKSVLYTMMLWPLVIPGVILGVSILQFSSTIANTLEDTVGFRIDSLRPGLPLVVLGQFSFIVTIASLVIAARLRRFDMALEEAALDLGATRWEAVRTITLPYLRPAMIGAGIISFLMSFENFNTTLMLVGSEAPVTIRMFTQIREGTTPVVNALSLLLIIVMACAALGLLFTGERKREHAR